MIIDTGEILERTLDLLRRNAPQAILVGAVMTIPAVLNGLGIGPAELIYPASLLPFVLQYWVTASLLNRLELRTASASRFPAYFVLSLVMGILILFGLVLLIVPGVYLMVRWSIAVPALVATDDRLFDALDYSWRETAESFWPILAAFLIIYALLVVGFVAGLVVEGLEWREAAVIVSETLLTLSLIAGWHAAVAIYAETQRDSRVTEVFA